MAGRGARDVRSRFVAVKRGCLFDMGFLGGFASAALLGAALAQEGPASRVDLRRGGGRRHSGDRCASPDRARWKRPRRRRRSVRHRARQPRRRAGVLVVRSVWWLVGDHRRIHGRLAALARTPRVGRSPMAVVAARRGCRQSPHARCASSRPSCSFRTAPLERWQLGTLALGSGVLWWVDVLVHAKALETAQPGARRANSRTRRKLRGTTWSAGALTRRHRFGDSRSADQGAWRRQRRARALHAAAAASAPLGCR